VVKVIFPSLANDGEFVLLGVGTIRFTSEAISKQMPLARLQVEPAGLHNKTLVNPAALQWTSYYDLPL